jgi:outer membrane protein OmpA-like peptidoglycan-associated protein
MITRRALSILLLAFALTFVCACATKKYVQQQVGTTKTELSTKIDEEASRRADLGNQLQELSSLNKRNTARIEEVNTNLGTAVKSLDPKIEDAKRTGTEARETATTALTASKENSAAFTNRNNYQPIETRDVLFKFGSAKLDDEGKQALDLVAKSVLGDKNLVLELQGYTDSVGDPEYNVQISNKRVDTVVRYLVGTAKVELHRIHALGLGEANPVDDNKTRAGRAKNRRVTVSVLGVK